MVYIRTIISADNEIKYVKLQLAESKGYVDKIIVCEFNITHTGLSRDFIFEKFMNDGTFSAAELDRIIYLKGVLDADELKAESKGNEHYIEQIFRGYFLKNMKLKLNDIVFCLDADEIVFRRSYPGILGLFKNPLANPNVQLPMYQFFYRPDYLWKNLVFRNPIVCRVRKEYFKKLPRLRDTGKDYLKEMVGCHFSWQLTIDEMIDKLRNYAHAKDYGHLAKRDVLADAVKNKKYPFEPDREFVIEEVNCIKNKEYYPDTFADFYEDFKYLLED